MKKAFGVFGLLVFYLLFGVAQNPTYYLNPNKRLPQYNFENWNTGDGLPTNSLLHLCQSNDGYLWITGYNGLIRFDGSHFSVFNSKNTDAFESDVVRKIAVDSSGTIWMTTQGSGLVSYSNGDFRSHGKDLEMLYLYRALLIDKQNRIWSASPEKGWFYLENGEFNFLAHTKSLVNTEVRDIAEGSNGVIWFGTLGEGLYRYENGRFKVYNDENGLPDNWVYSLYVDRNDVLWVGTSNGLYYFDGKKFHEVPFPNPSTINRIVKDRYDNLWFGTLNGLYRRNSYSGEIELLNKENGLEHNFIVDFLFDKEGNLWLTNYKGGLSCIKDGKFTNYSESGGLDGKVVNAICEIESSSYLVAFDNGSLNLIKDGVVHPFMFKNDISGNRIRHILKDSKKNLWISMYDGLLKVTAEGKEIWISEDPGFPASKIRLTFEDSNGNIWIGSRNYGLFRYDGPGKYSIFDTQNGLSSNLIMSIDEGRDGALLVGTSEGDCGFNRIVGGQIIERIDGGDEVLTDIVFNSYTDPSGAIWIAANGGLIYSKGEKIAMITSKNGLEDDSPYDVIEDDHGFLWMPFSKGIMKIEKANIIDFVNGKVDRVSCRVFDQYDGMKNSECNPTTQSLKASDGSIFFATLDGLVQIDPSNILVNNYVPPVVIEDFKVDNQSVLGQQMVFNPGKRRYTFNYTALSLYEPEKTRFRYQLVGYDKDWMEVGNERSVSYTNLGHGDYTFKVIACNNDGLWNEVGSELSFRVKTPFTQTLLFYLLLLFTIVAAVFAFYRVRLRSLEARQLELERTIRYRTEEVTRKNAELEEQKERIEAINKSLHMKNDEIQAQSEKLNEQKQELKILNASKDKLFSIIAHDLRNPLGNFKGILDLLLTKKEKYDADQKDKMLLMLSKLAKSTYDLLENLLSWSKSQRGIINYEPETFLVAPVIEEVVDSMSHSATEKAIELYVRLSDTDIVYADRKMVELIFRNLIGNAIKFTPKEGVIEIEGFQQNGSIEFSISDSGIGISDEMKDKIFNPMEHTTTYGTENEKGSGLGLILCKEMVEKNKGEIWFESGSEGTTFFVRLNMFP